MRHQVLLAAYYKAANAKIHLSLPYVFLFLLSDDYYILFYAISLPFLFINFLPPSPDFSALDDRPVCLVVTAHKSTRRHSQKTAANIFTAARTSRLRVLFHIKREESL
jgi:hypothetical protein